MLETWEGAHAVEADVSARVPGNEPIAFYHGAPIYSVTTAEAARELESVFRATRQPAVIEIAAAWDTGTERVPVRVLYRDGQPWAHAVRRHGEWRLYQLQYPRPWSPVEPGAA